MLSRLLKNRALSGLIIGLLISGILILGNSLSIFESLHEYFADTLYTRNEPTDNIVIIAIDEKSTLPEPDGFGRYSLWTRDKHVDLLEILEQENPAVIGYDIIFNAPTSILPSENLLELELVASTAKSQQEENEIYENFIDEYKSTLKNPIDNEFAEKLQEFDNIVLAASQVKDGSFVLPWNPFQKNAAIGIVNAPLNEKGIIREAIPYFSQNDKTYDDFAIAVVKKYTGNNNIDLPVKENQFLVNFFGEPYSYPIISFVDVVNGKYDPGFFNNKIVLIGVTSTKEIHDEFYTPKDNSTPMSGVEFRANEIQTILEEKFLINQSQISRFLVIGSLSIGLVIILNFLGIALSITITLLSFVGYLLAAHFFYKKGLILNMVYPFLAILLAYLSSWVYKYFIADRKKRELKSAFSHYVSKDLVEKISKNPELVKLGGEKRMITVFFSDIEDSTKISEKTTIESWVAQINEYFTVMEKILQKHGGTLDKYEGDAIMGFWNAPIPQEDHMMRAYKAALEMQEALVLLNQRWIKQGRPAINCRIGINTGQAIVGNFGSESRFDYTVMGDTVNTASRLESAANKAYGTSLIIAGFENKLNGEEKNKIITRELDTVYLPGKNEPIVLYELICLKEKLKTEDKQIIETYAKALAAYRQKDFEKAINLLEEIENDAPSKIILERCKSLLKGEKIRELDKKMIFRITNK